MREIAIHTPFITLDQFLKWAGVVGTGGEGKALLARGRVRVAGAVETRRGRKLHPGDVVEVGRERLVVTSAAGLTPGED